MPDLGGAAAESLLQGLHEVFIELEGKHPVEPSEQWFCQGASTGSDFEDPRRFVGQHLDDAGGDVAIDEKVLTEPAAFWSSHRRVMSFEFWVLS